LAILLSLGVCFDWCNGGESAEK